MARTHDSVEEQQPIEVIEFVLKGPGGETFHFEFERCASSVERLDTNVYGSRNDPPEIRN